MGLTFTFLIRNPVQVSGGGRGRERHAAAAADAHGGRLAARAHPAAPPRPARPAHAINTHTMELADVPRHRPLAFDKSSYVVRVLNRTTLNIESLAHFVEGHRFNIQDPTVISISPYIV
ncbi:hypothetical protein EVAR_27224_1 [Eumeta japonica]|uniref:Uncharacterized protein n=1 Tax=Eumeta variegata TaxID=151549 RepID=A0A4C1VVR5_EUMVA|nr:hypothetical protein EVAR_27224_1 [Eumeta japonica]